MRRSLTVAAALLTLAGASAAIAEGRGEGAEGSKPPVIRLKNPDFGYILTTRSKLPLYFWNREKDFKIRCTGQCARVWPPVLLGKGQSMPRRLAGVKGTFGAIKRPDGRRQVTYNKRPLYAYHNDPPNKVLCDNVDGWFVVRV